MRTALLILTLALPACTAPFGTVLLDKLVKSGCAVSKLQANHKKEMMTVDCAEVKTEEDYLNE